MLGAVVVCAAVTAGCDRIVNLTPFYDAPPGDGGLDADPDGGNPDPIDSGRGDGNPALDGGPGDGPPTPVEGP
jgi:hypothetical protein